MALPFNPASVLQGLPAGFAPKSSAAAYGGYMDVLNASPFNVGSGEQNASASAAPSGALPGQIGNTLAQNLPMLALIGGGLWIVAKVVK